jgi:small nuclear ribonucleoprotein (snRNP)-like protein
MKIEGERGDGVEAVEVKTGGEVKAGGGVEGEGGVVGQQVEQREVYSYAQEDAAKVIRGFYKSTRTEEFRSMLRQEYLLQLMMFRRIEGVRDKRKAVVVTPRFIAVGDLVAVDPDHANIVLMSARLVSHEVELKLNNSKMLIRGDQVQYVALVEPSQVEDLIEALK